MSRSNGRPEPEVIVNYSDGFAYSKHKMEEAFRAGGFLEKPTAAKASGAGGSSAASSAKREDVDVLVHEFGLLKAQAEKVLIEHGGNLTKALRAMVGLPAAVGEEVRTNGDAHST